MAEGNEDEEFTLSLIHEKASGREWCMIVQRRSALLNVCLPCRTAG